MAVILKAEIKFLEMKTATSEMQNALNGIRAEQDISQKITDIEDAKTESVQMRLEERKTQKNRHH